MSRWRRWFLGIVLLGSGLGLIWPGPPPACAHPLDEAMQLSTLTVAWDQITIEIEIMIGPLLIDRLANAVNTNGDTEFSPAEQEAWGQQLTGYVSLSIDGQVVPLRLMRVRVPTYRALLNEQECVTVCYQAAIGDASNQPDRPHRVTYVNKYLKALSFYATSVLVHEDVDMDISNWRDDGSVYSFVYGPAKIPAPTPRPTDISSPPATAVPTRPSLGPAGTVQTPLPTIPTPARTSVPRTPVLRTSVLRTSVLRTSVLRTSVLRTPVLRTPVLRTPSPGPVTPTASRSLGAAAGSSTSGRPRPPMRDRPLEGLLRTTNLDVGFVFVALGLSVVIGGLHALTPGHGKAIVAAYLVGARGTLRHATFLGGIVTATHTASVIVLGVLMLLATQFILPELVIPWLEILSGLLIVGMGASLLWQRLRDPTGHGHRHLPGPIPVVEGTAWAKDGVLDARQVNVAVMGHTPELADLMLRGGQEPELVGRARLEGATDINLLGLCCSSEELRQELVVTTGLVDAVVVDREGEYPALTATAARYGVPIVRVNTPAALADPLGTARAALDAATEHFVQRIADQARATGLTVRNLVTLGISGGLVPCPDALAILLLAVALNRVVFGLSIIVAFSVGLAIALIAIGMFTVTSRSFLERFTSLGRATRWVSSMSAIVVIVLGLAMIVQVMSANAASLFQ